MPVQISQLPTIDLGEGWRQTGQSLANIFQRQAEQRKADEQQRLLNFRAQKQAERDERRVASEEEAQKRQMRKEMGEEHEKIRKLAAQDPTGQLAHSYVTSLGFKANLEPQYGPAPQMPAQGGSAVPDQLDQGRSLKDADLSFADAPQFQQMLAQQPAMPVEPPPFQPPAAGPPEAPAQEPQEGPQLPAQAPGPPARGPLTGYRLRYQLGDGPETVLDTGEMKAAEQAQQKTAREELAQQLTDGAIPEKYRQAAATWLRMGVRPEAVMSKMIELQEKDAAAVARVELEKSQQAGGKYKRGHGGGGGGGNPRLAGAAATLTDMIENGQNGEPYPTSELQRKATELGLPLTGKAGSLSLNDLLKTTTFRQKGTDIHHRSTERDAAVEITDDQGNVLGKAKSAIEARQLNKSNAAFAQFSERAQALIDDIEKQGDRVLAPQDIQRRQSLGAALAAAGRVYNGLGATDASQKLEQDIIGALGSPGHGFLMGANADIVKHTFDEAKKQHSARLNIGLRAGSQGKGSKTVDDHLKDIFGR